MQIGARLAAGLLLVLGGAGIAGASAEPLRAQEPDSVEAAPGAGQPADTVAAADSARPGVDDPGGVRAVPDSLQGLPDSTLAKIRARTPLFPEDVDPYTAIGLGRPSIVLSREDLVGWPSATLAGILPRLLPLGTDDQGGPGFFQDLRFPSGPAGETRILIDGRPLESALGPAADLRAIPVAALERIEIRPGAAPVTGGPAAGWINLVTRTHLTPQSNSALSFELGAFGQEGFSASLGRWLGTRFSAFASLNFDDAETFTTVADASRSRVFAKARYYLSRRHFVEAAFGTAGVTVDSQRSDPSEPSPFTGIEDRRERRLQALYRGRIGGVLASARVFSDRFEEREAFTLGDRPLLRGDVTRRGARVGARVPVRFGFAEVGGEWQEDKLDSDRQPFPEEEDVPAAEGDSVPLFDARTARAALFAGAEIAIDSLALAAHARMERFEVPSTVTEPAFSVEARYAGPAGLAPFVRGARSARQPAFVEQAVLVNAGVPGSTGVTSVLEARAGAGWRGPAGLTAEVAGFRRRGDDVPVWLPPTA
ncbi:MAG: TonB-dependent receptor plug domain-containing protein, partial [Gemmatimonadetes bacterium]|nr:TonB-dependent receptor plug domain-containing protein [Gemmatimonadota bacterium]